MLRDKLNSDMLVALKSGEKIRLSTLRFLLAEINQYEIDNYPPGSEKKLTDEDVLKIIRKQVKNHQDSIAAFAKADRADLVEKETTELKILQSYLPAEISDAQLMEIVEKVVKSGVVNYGQAMGMVMKQVAGRASGDRVAQVVKKYLEHDINYPNNQP